MSLVYFPFRTESADQVLANADIAIEHAAVTQVLLVGAADATNGQEISDRAADSDGISVLSQQRIGRLRPGKGDGINTALGHFIDSGADRMHVFDADITSFGPEWITAGEEGLDQGFEVVRHAYWRAATDGMITWMITRPMLAMTYPEHQISRLRQPLGGELAIERGAARRLSGVDLVRDRSGWGIDTAIVHAAAALGLRVKESFRAEGKEHALYGTLEELRTMVVECFDAVGSLDPSPLPDARFESDSPTEPTGTIRRSVAYDIAGTTRRVSLPLSEEALARLDDFPPSVGRRFEAVGSGNLTAMDDATWRLSLLAFSEGFDVDDRGRADLLFRLWEARVLSYTASMVGRSYIEAMNYLEGTVEGFRSVGRERA